MSRRHTPLTKSSWKNSTNRIAREKAASQTAADNPERRDFQEKDPDADMKMFQEAMKGIVPLKQDKMRHSELTGERLRQARTQKDKTRQNQHRHGQFERISQQEKKRSNASFQFSDGYEAWFDPNQPLKFSRSKTLSGEVKRLRRGEYAPDLTLDLHGYNREDAKWEVAEFLHVAVKYHHYCVCIVHGIGSRVLKQQIPNWLVQHPNVLGFHEAPLEWGGKGALLVLMDVKDPESGEWRAR